jgi:hypothetical protein
MQHNTPTPRSEKRMARTRATSNSSRRLCSKFSALGTPSKPNRDVLRNALRTKDFFLFFCATAWPFSEPFA